MCFKAMKLNLFIVLQQGFVEKNIFIFKYTGNMNNSIFNQYYQPHCLLTYCSCVKRCSNSVQRQPIEYQHRVVPDDEQQLLVNAKQVLQFCEILKYL